MTQQDLISLYKQVLTNRTRVQDISEMWHDFARAAFNVDELTLVTPGYVELCERFVM